MKNLVILLVLAVTANTVLAEGVVYFADENLKAAVEDELSIFDPNATDMLGLTNLNADNKGIKDLTGLEYATNLTDLDLNWNYGLGDISAVSSLINLTYLSIQGCQISDISVVSSLSKLKSLALGANLINDVNAVSGLTNLTKLYLWSNQINDISALSDLSDLTGLNLQRNKIENISAISTLTKLQWIYLDENKIEDISAISGLKALKTLVLSENQIADITAVSELSSLTTLKLASNKITDCNSLENLGNLTLVELQENQIRDISELSHLANLTRLYLYGNPLNTEAYCIYLPLIEHNNPGILLSYDANPNPFESCVPNVIYVDANAIGANDGSNWEDSFNYLQDALEVATIGDVILAAEGTYRPDHGGGNTNGDRLSVFQLIGGVGVYGGFPSGGALWETRDPNLYPTILSGDLNEDDIEVTDPCDLLDEPTRAENSYHVVKSNSSLGVILDGFIITGGNANVPYAHRSGGGMIVGGRIKLLNCIFAKNTAGYTGGGLNNNSSSCSISNCVFRDNAVGMEGEEYAEGGGLHNDGTDAIISSCLFESNWSTVKGGGMSDHGPSNIVNKPRISNCTFIGNRAEYKGGGMYVQDSTPTIENCEFTENYAGPDEHSGSALYDWCGGGIYNWDCSPILSSCTFVRNFAYLGGGGVCNSWYSDTILNNCKFTGNSAGWDGGGIYNNYSSAPTVETCEFTGNSAKYGGAINNERNSEPLLTNCTFTSNVAELSGGGIDNSHSNPIVTSSMFTGNSASWGGGIHNFNSNPIVSNSIFGGNSADKGGGIYNQWEVSIILANCSFAGNSATTGNTIVCDSHGQSHPSVLQINNSILWDGGEGIFNGDSSEITITYSDVQGGWFGEGNIENDPLFFDPGYWDPNGTVDNAGDDFWVAGDYHLQSNSPCIDAGDPNYITEPNETDLDGNPRIVNGIVDMGVYESSMAPIEAYLKILPHKIIRHSRKKLIMAWLRLPEEITKDQIESNEPLLLYPGGIAARHQYVFQSRRAHNRYTRIFAFFDRTALMEAVADNGNVELEVFGNLTTGQSFYGSDTIRIMGLRWRNPWRWRGP